MKSWKQHPYLFWEFDCQSVQDGKKAIHKVWWILKHDKINGTDWIDDCTLIARPISNMTDEELMKATRYHDSVPYNRDKWIEHLKTDCAEDTKNGVVNLDLLSAGVYPFDPSHFDLPYDDPAKVIDATKLED